MSAKSKVKKIGGNWVEAVDATSGKTYYANLITKETTWSYPSIQIKKEEAELEKKRQAEAKKNAKAEDVWVERQDKTGM